MIKTLFGILQMFWKFESDYLVHHDLTNEENIRYYTRMGTKKRKFSHWTYSLIPINSSFSNYAGTSLPLPEKTYSIHNQRATPLTKKKKSSKLRKLGNLSRTRAEAETSLSNMVPKSQVGAEPRHRQLVVVKAHLNENLEMYRREFFLLLIELGDFEMKREHAVTLDTTSWKFWGWSNWILGQGMTIHSGIHDNRFSPSSESSIIYVGNFQLIEKRSRSKVKTLFHVF